MGGQKKITKEKELSDPFYLPITGNNHVQMGAWQTE